MKRKSWLVAATAAVAFLSLSAAVGQSNNDTNTNTNTYQQLNLFGDVFEKIRSDYVEPVSDEKLVELHGTDRLVTCLACGQRFEPSAVYENLPEDFASPRCDSCGGFLKSANVSFGQQMPAEPMRRAREWSEASEVFMVLGSSLQVQPAASFPVIAKQSGALLAIINRDETPLDELADFVHHGPIGPFFEKLNPLLDDGSRL